MLKKQEEDKRRQLQEEDRRRLEEEKRLLEENRKAEEERLRLEEEARRRAEAEREKLERELAESLASQMAIVEEPRKEESKEKKKSKVSVSGQRSKKPTMAREWRKLKEKQKHEKEAVDQLAVERMEVDTTPELSPPPPRAKYVPPVFKENECYSDRQDTFLRGAWPHNNKKGIPTPSELAEAGFFFIGPGDYCRWGSATVTCV